MPETPYKGLIPYAEEDAPFFFGREAECEIITANLMASRLTLLYGESGVGKSSVLHAGVAAGLRRLSREAMATLGAPESVVVVFSAWRDDPIAGLETAVRAAVADLFRDAPDSLPPVAASETLVDALDAWSARTDAELLIILDQFEEYFLYHESDERAEGFFAQFPRAVNAAALRANFLIAIREDALAKLDRFKGRIPNLFDNYLRIEHLSREAGRAAITGPIGEYNLRHAAAVVEPALVEAVLDQVAIGRVSFAEGGRAAIDDAVTAGSPDARIETPYLQLVMSRLWEEDAAVEPPVLRRATLDRLGGAERIVRSHLDAVLGALSPDDQEMAARVFRHLVTASGTKVAYTAADLADYAGIAPERLTPVLERLSAGDVRILRPVSPPVDDPGAPRYEIFHDVLAAAVLDWRRRFVQAQERLDAERQLAAERRRVARLRLGLLGLSAVVLVMAGLLLFAFQQRAQADRARREANAQRAEALAQRDAAEKARAELVAQQRVVLARDLAADAVERLSTDPQLSLLLASEAVAFQEAPQTEDALRRAMLAMRGRATLRGHTDAVLAAVFSPDGERVVTGSNDGTARLWDARTGETTAELRGHDATVRAAAFSGDGRLAVTAGDDGTARVWDARSGAPVAALVGHAAAVRTARFSPDAEAARVLTASWDGTARLWDARSGAVLQELSGHSAGVNDALFSPDGRRIATASSDGTVRLWDAATGATLRELRGGGAPVGALAFSPNGRLLASAGALPVAQVWDVEGGSTLSGSFSHGGPVLAVAFSPDGQRMLSTGADGSARTWNVESGALLADLRGHAADVYTARFSGDGRSIATASRDGTARIWDAQTGRMTAELRGHTAPVWTATFDPSSQLVLTASQDGTARLWRAADGRDFTESRGHTQELLGATFSPDGHRLVTTSADRSVRVWDTLTGRQTALLSRPDDTIRVAAFTPDGQHVVMDGADHALRIMELATGREVGALIGHVDTVASVAFSEDGRGVLTAAAAGTVRVWDAAMQRQTGQFDAARSGLRSASFSPDRTQIVTVSAGNTANIWDATTGAAVATLMHRGHVWSARFSPDGRRLVTASSDSTAAVWDAATGRRVSELTGFRAPVLAATFVGDGQRVLTVSRDGLIQVWEVATGRRTLSIQGAVEDIQLAAIGPTGAVALAGSDRVVRIYPPEMFTSPTELRALAASRAGRRLLPEERERFLHEAPEAERDRPMAGTSVDDWTVSNSEEFEAGTNDVAGPGGATVRYLKAAAPEPRTAALVRGVPADQYQGKRVRVTASLRTDRVEGSAGLALRALGANGELLAADFMRRWRPITGTTDWAEYELVSQIPQNAARIEYGISMAGKGRVLVHNSDLQPTTDAPIEGPLRDGWGVAGQNPLDYDMRTIEQSRHDGLVVRRVKSLSPNPRTFGTDSWGFPADAYRGKRIRMTASARSENVDISAGLWMRVDGPGGTMVLDNMSNSGRPIRGSTDWQQYEIVLNVPENATAIVFGCLLYGIGEVWFDEPRFDVVGTDVPVTMPR